MVHYSNKVNKYLKKYEIQDYRNYFDSSTKAMIINMLSQIEVKNIIGNYLIDNYTKKPVISLKVDEYSKEFILTENIFILDKDMADILTIQKINNMNQVEYINLTDSISQVFLRNQVLLFYCLYKTKDQDYQTEEMKTLLNQHIFNNSMKLIVKESLDENN